MKVWPVILIFLLIGAYIIVSANDIDFKDGEERTDFIYKFSKWVLRLGGNFKTITGHAINMQWLPDTEVNVNKTINSTE